MVTPFTSFRDQADRIFGQLPDLARLSPGDRPGPSQSDFGPTFDAESFLRDVPEASFFSFQDQFGKSPNQRQSFERSFQDFQNRFLGESGKKARQGEEPGNFLEFLENQFDPSSGVSQAERRFLSKSPGQRNDFSSFLNPRTRFLVNF